MKSSSRSKTSSPSTTPPPRQTAKARKNSRLRDHVRGAALRLEISAAVGARYAAYLSHHLAAGHALLRPALRELSLALVNDAAMSQLHQQFLGIAAPTDVLTFELEHDARGRIVGGEVVVCVPEARRQARQRATPVEWELLLYALHGMLHLIGFDDRTESGYLKMHRKEDQILTQLGVGAVFAGEKRRRLAAGAEDA